MFQNILKITFNYKYYLIYINYNIFVLKIYKKVSALIDSNSTKK